MHSKNAPTEDCNFFDNYYEQKIICIEWSDMSYKHQESVTKNLILV